MNRTNIALASRDDLRTLQQFSLIELLVVMAIIALMVAILFPALARARQTAHSIACKSNLKQVGMALHYYGDDNDMWVPSSYFAASTQTWMDKLDVYLKTARHQRGVLCCPAQKGLFYPLDKDYVISNYACNASAMHTDNLSTNVRIQLVKLNFSGISQIMAVADGGSRPDEVDRTYWWFRHNDPDFARLGWPHPSSTSNFVFFDGHVDSTKKFLTYQERPLGWKWNQHDLTEPCSF